MMQPGLTQVPPLWMSPTVGYRDPPAELGPALTTVAVLRFSVLYVQVVMSSSPWGGRGWGV